MADVVADRLAIEDALARFVYGVDRLDWDLFASVLTEDFRYGVKEPDGTRLVWFDGKAEMLARIRPVAEGARAAQHFCPNPLVALHGDEATMLVNHMAYLWTDEPGGGAPRMRMVAGRWEAELRREGQQWLFSGMVFDPTFLNPWADDPASFPPRGPMAGTPW